MNGTGTTMSQPATRRQAESESVVSQSHSGSQQGSHQMSPIPSRPESRQLGGEFSPPGSVSQYGSNGGASARSMRSIYEEDRIRDLEAELKRLKTRESWIRRLTGNRPPCPDTRFGARSECAAEWGLGDGNADGDGVRLSLLLNYQYVIICYNHQYILMNNVF